VGVGSSSACVQKTMSHWRNSSCGELIRNIEYRGSWRWSITLKITVFLDFAHRPQF
jgi:hypothetical protein